MKNVAQDSFVGFVLEQLADLQGLGCRAMFGGHGLFLGPTFFGILFDGRLYLKTDDSTVTQYSSRGMGPFQPNDKQVLKSYYEVPADVLENRAELARWAGESVRAARGTTDSRADGSAGNGHSPAARGRNRASNGATR